MKHFSIYSALFLSPLVWMSGCSTVVMNPSGDIAGQEANLILTALALMLLIIVPVIALTIFFAWRYRASNTNAIYTPEWDHSTKLELIIWGAPICIILALGTITWISTHELDPYKPLSRINAEQKIPSNVKPLIVEVVALDWKWLFIYPEQGIATVNELVAPVNVPIRFKISASNVMNSFYIPALAGQIYAMPGMQTTLNAVINKPGVYDGFSANYSGAGFSDMRFKFHGNSVAEFKNWVASIKAQGGTLDREAYLRLEKPSEKNPVEHYSIAEPGLFDAVVNRCVEKGSHCMDMGSMKMDKADTANVAHAASTGEKKEKTGAVITEASALPKQNDQLDILHKMPDDTMQQVVQEKENTVKTTLITMKVHHAK
jgi:cytochrome o ubiquinol oxidase subunit 2